MSLPRSSRDLVRSGGYSLFHCDCLEGLTALPDGCVEAVITSPPYNLGIAYSKYRDRLSEEDYLAWTTQWGAEIARVLSENGSFFLNVAGSPSKPLLPLQVVQRLSGGDGPFVLQNTFHWIKAITIEQPDDGEELSVGHFKPINSQRFVNDCHEYVFHLTTTGRTPLDRLAVGVTYADKSNIRRWAHTGGRDRRCRGNTWYVPYETIQVRDRDRPHPATFPVRLAENCLRIHGLKPADLVLDPFLGLGSSAVAAQNCGVKRFVGFDIDLAYLQVAQERLAETGARSQIIAAEVAA